MLASESAGFAEAAALERIGDGVGLVLVVLLPGERGQERHPRHSQEFRRFRPAGRAERLARDGARSARVFDAVGPHMMTHLRVLAEPRARDEAIAAIFEETTTIGVRHSLVERSILERRAETVEVDGRAFRRKVVSRPSGAAVKAEADDLAGVGRQATRAGLRYRVEQMKESDEP